MVWTSEVKLISCDGQNLFLSLVSGMLAGGGNLFNFVGLDCPPKMPVLNLPDGECNKINRGSVVTGTGLFRSPIARYS